MAGQAHRPGAAQRDRAALADRVRVLYSLLQRLWCFRIQVSGQGQPEVQAQVGIVVRAGWGFRTATVVAHTAATVYELDREPFLTAVLGHAPAQRQADRIADTRLATGCAPADSDTAG